MLTKVIVMIWLTPSINNPSQLPLMLNHGNSIQVVFSMIVVPNSIMVSSPLDIPQMLGSLKTHGVDHGENKDTSDLPEGTPVVSVTQPHIPQYEKS